jgi:hypothetical protein
LSLFRDEEQLTEHQRAASPCDINTLSTSLAGEGFDARQEKELKRRSRGQRTEKEKWEEMYHILFPDDEDGFSPDPCE